MEITARVANLGKYAAGILADTELSFPTTTQRVQNALRKIGVDGLRYEEIIILDYTASVPLLSSRLGEYARIDELNYLACRLAGMSQGEKAKFSAALEHGDYGGDLSGIIDLTYHLDCYTLLPEIRSYEDYGYHLVESRRDFYLPQKARYYFDFSQYGEDTIINEGGTLTPQGYIRADRGKVFTQVYDGEHISSFPQGALPIFCRPVYLIVIDSYPSIEQCFTTIHNAENFFSILKTECIYRHKLTTSSEANEMIDRYIHFYNHERIQRKTEEAPLARRLSA